MERNAQKGPRKDAGKGAPRKDAGKGAPKQLGVKVTTETRVILNSFEIRMDKPLMVKITRVIFDEEIENMREKEEREQRKLGLVGKMVTGSVPIIFDGVNFLVTLENCEVVAVPGVASVKTECVDYLTNLMESEEDAPRADTIISLACRKKEDIRFGRLFGQRLNEQVLMAPCLEWMRCYLASVVCGTLVVNVRDEVITPERDVPAIDYLKWKKAKPQDLNSIEEALKGLRLRVVLANYVRDFSVRGVKLAKDVPFPVHKNLKEKYGVDCKNNVLICARGEPKTADGPCSLYYPLDVIKIRRNQRVHLEFLTDELLKKNQAPPSDRLKRQIDAVKRLNEGAGMKYLNVFVVPEPMHVNAKILVSPDIVGANQKRISSFSADWSMQGSFIEAAGTVDCQLFAFEKTDGAVEQFNNRFVPEFGKVGIRLNLIGGLQNAVDIVQKKWKNPSKGRYMAFVLVNSTREYDAVKRVFDTQGIPSQCMNPTPKKFFSDSPSYAKNVSLKVNAKLSGANWSIDSRSLSAKKTLVLALDVYHPPQGSSNNSVVALVGSVRGDTTFQKYDGVFRSVENRKELGTLSLDMLKHFATTTKYERIVYFRDGIGKQSVEQVLQSELPLLRSTFPGVPVALVLVTKRHHHRIFTAQRENVVAGTFVTGPCLPKNSFLLNSHTGRLGTSHCSSYYVLENDTGLSLEELGKIAFDLAHAHPRATKAVSLPSPLYQAHLLAYRTRNYTAENEHKNIKVTGMYWE